MDKRKSPSYPVRSASHKLNKSSKAGVIFPVSRLHRFLRESRDNGKVTTSAAVYLAAVLEYLAAEVLEMSGHVTKESKKTRIQPRHILLAVRQDDEFNKLLDNITIAEGGVLPTLKIENNSSLTEPSQAV